METNDDKTPVETNTSESAAPEASAASEKPIKTPEPTESASEPSPTSTKSTKSTIWCLSILAIIGITAAAAFAYLYFTTPTTTPSPSNPNNSQSSTAPSTPNNNQGTTPSETEQSSSAPSNSETTTTITLDEAKALLADKYKFPSVARPIFDGWHRYIENFNQAAKLLFVIHQLEDEFTPQANPSETATKREISFDDFNSKYVYYFGSKESLEKKTYQLSSDIYLSEIVYQPENDSFAVLFPNGIGGTTTARRVNKVISVSDIQDGFKAIVASTTIELNDDGDYTTGLLESLSVYEFYFTKENDEYVLTSIKKL
ncbi:hypothetical protein IKG49_01185 [Candidatus Saccharibacteria bacterium]|nr:hypothetical protein [Candidatus Saccharibacteria bacterium]